MAVRVAAGSDFACGLCPAGDKVVNQSTDQPLVAVVEDERDLCALLEHNLKNAGFRTWVEYNGRNALRRLHVDKPDIVLLDLMLPDIFGTAVLAELRRDESLRYIPVIVLTAKSEEPDELVGFSLGADDYVGKPFSMEVLVARVRAVLRRCESSAPDSASISVGPFELAAERNSVTVDGQTADLTRTEFQLLHHILRAGGRVVYRNRLIEQVFDTTDPTDRRVDVHMTNLRRKIGARADWIRTIRGIGYACRSPESSDSDDVAD